MTHLKLSKRDIRSLDFYYKIGSILAITPNYNFEKNQIIHPLLTKIYGICISVIFLGTKALSMFQTLQVTSYSNFMSFQVVSFLNSLCLVFLSLSIISSSCVFNQHEWSKINRNLQYVDKKLNNRNKKSGAFYKSACFEFIVFVCWFFAMDIYGVYRIYLMGSLSNVVNISFLLHQICYFFESFTIILTYNILTAFKGRFQDLNRKFLQVKTPTRTSIRDVATLWRILTESVLCFNRVFGWFLFFLLGRGILQILLSMSLVLSIANKEEDLKAANPHSVIFHFVLLIFFLVSCILLNW
jgi:gustatory receptor